MRLRALEAFCLAVEHQSISGAARQMYLSQPSVSETLAELERQARMPLLRRSQHGVVPTSQGQVVYRHARRILDEVKVLESTLDALHGEHKADLRLGACLNLGEYLVPEWLRHLRGEFPDLSYGLFMGNNQEVGRAVTNGDVALGLIAEDDRHDSLDRTPFLEDELVVVVAPGHPWAAKGGVLPESLTKEPFISREAGSTTRELIEKTLSKVVQSPLDCRMELGSITAIKAAIKAGLGFSIVSRVSVRGEVHSGELAIVRGFAIPVRFVIASLPKPVLSPAEARFRTYLLEAG